MARVGLTSVEEAARRGVLHCVGASVTASGLVTTCARLDRRLSRKRTKHLSRSAGASIGSTQVWPGNEHEQAHAVAVSCELSVRVPEASACMGHDGPKRTADQAMGSQRPGAHVPRSGLARSEVKQAARVHVIMSGDVGRVCAPAAQGSLLAAH